MEFSEKLQQLRKSKGLTQEELAQALFVSRTAVSKWESGRGYPGIDSLKEISRYFSVSIDDLLSGEKLLSVAQQEHRAHIRRICGYLFGTADLFSFLLILLPLYPKTVDGYVYSVNLPAYTESSPLNRFLCWALFSALILTGAVSLLALSRNAEKTAKAAAGCSLALGIAAVIVLSLTGQTYAVTVAFLLLLVKGALLFRAERASSNSGNIM